MPGTRRRRNFDREHVTPFIRAHPKLTKINLSSDRDYSSERWTIDEFRDFEVISNIIEHFSPNLDFEWSEVLELRKTHPEYFISNKILSRN